MLAFTETAFSSASPRRVVLDTNVLVSIYIFADSRFAPLRARIESGEWQAITNDACFEEFRRVLGYAMFALTEPQQEAALGAYGAVATQLAGPPAGDIASLPRCADRDDQKFLELARDCRADWLLTKDRDLLVFARRKYQYLPFRIVTPAQFARARSAT